MVSVAQHDRDDVQDAVTLAGADTDLFGDMESQMDENKLHSKNYGQEITSEGIQSNGEIFTRCQQHWANKDSKTDLPVPGRGDLDLSGRIETPMSRLPANCESGTANDKKYPKQQLKSSFHDHNEGSLSDQTSDIETLSSPMPSAVECKRLHDKGDTPSTEKQYNQEPHSTKESSPSTINNFPIHTTFPSPTHRDQQIGPSYTQGGTFKMQNVDHYSDVEVASVPNRHDIFIDEHISKEIAREAFGDCVVPFVPEVITTADTEDISTLCGGHYSEVEDAEAGIYKQENGVDKKTLQGNKFGILEWIFISIIGISSGALVFLVIGILKNTI